MRVLLVTPPLQALGELAPPLGLCTLAAWLLNEGHDVAVLDLDLERRLAPDVDYRARLRRALADCRPEAVCVTSMYSNSLHAQRLIEEVKAFDDDIATIAGGPHFGALCRESVERVPELDFVVLGEGEIALAALLDALTRGTGLETVPRLAWRSDGVFRQNDPGRLLDLSQLPGIWTTVADRVDLTRYAETIPRHSADRSVYIEAGRGCPYACSFCATAPFWEHKFRVKPVARIVEEMHYLNEQLGYDTFLLVHDLPTVGRRFIEALSDALIEARLPVKWMVNHRTDIDLRGLLPKMKMAGCFKLFMGIETASAKQQEEIGKGLRREQILSTVTQLGETGLTGTASFVIGFPRESREQLSATVAMAVDLKLRGIETVQIHRLRLWPPARLARDGQPAAFDAESLAIEYPFIEVPARDLEAIKADPVFFAGYFAPHSTAGSFRQVSQVELFFGQAIALVPLTVRVMATVLAERLIDAFYDALGQGRAVRRDELSVDLWANWKAISPFLDRWIDATRLEPWQRSLVEGIGVYEAHRLAYVSRGVADEALSRGDGWAVFVLSVDIPALLRCIREDVPLSADLLQPTTIAFAHSHEHGYAAYEVAEETVAALRDSDPQILSQLDRMVIASPDASG